MTHIDLFSGIGGFALAAQWAGFKTVAFCEIEPFCREVLEKHWPGIPVIERIQDFNWPMADLHKRGKPRQTISARSRAKGKREIDISGNGQIKLLTGGFPCQPFSCAGKRRGKADDRWLWPEMLRVIKEVRPDWLLIENVAGIVRMALDDCLSDLESETYSCQAFIIPACSVNAPHRRDRVWIVAYSKCERQRFGNDANEEVFGNGSKKRKGRGAIYSGYTGDYWAIEPAMDRVVHGVPRRVDRLKALGNAIVPQVAYQIIKEIARIENET